MDPIYLKYRTLMWDALLAEYVEASGFSVRATPKQWTPAEIEVLKARIAKKPLQPTK